MEQQTEYISTESEYRAFNATLDLAISELKEVYEQRVSKGLEAGIAQDLVNRVYSAKLNLGPHFRDLSTTQQQSALGYIEIVDQCVQDHLELVRINELFRVKRVFSGKNKTK